MAEDMTNRVDSRLWDGSEPGWVLVGDKADIDRLRIYHRSQVIRLVENQAVRRALVLKMLAHDVEVIPEFPPFRDIEPTKMKLGTHPSF